MCNRRRRTHDCGCNKVRLGRAIRSSRTRTKTSEREGKKFKERGARGEPLPAVHGREKVNKAGFALMSASVHEDEEIDIFRGFDVVVYMPYLTVHYIGELGSRTKA